MRSASPAGAITRTITTTGAPSTTSATATCSSPARWREEMRGNFEAFWTSPISVPAERLDDVGRLLLREGAPPLEHAAFKAPERVAQMSNDAADAARARDARGRGDARRRRALHRRPAGEAPGRERHGRKRRPAPARHRRIGADRSAAADALPGAVEGSAGNVPRHAPAAVGAARDDFDEQPGLHRRVHRLRAVLQVQAPLPARIRLPHLRVQAVPGRGAHRPGGDRRRRRGRSRSARN